MSQDVLSLAVCPSVCFQASNSRAESFEKLKVGKNNAYDTRNLW